MNAGVGVLARGARDPSAAPPGGSRGPSGRSVRRALALGALTVALILAGALAPILRGGRQMHSGVAGRDPSSLAAGAPAILSGTLAEQIESLQARLRSVPKDWRSWATLGLAYVQQARVTADPRFYPKAEGALRRSLALNRSGNFEADVGEGALALARHDFSGALRWGARARSINPYSANVYGVIGDAQVELGRYGRAFRTFQHMVDLHPELSSYARASYALELQGDAPAAIRAMRMALGAAGTPEDRAFAAYQLGELFFSTGRVRRASHLYREAVALAPEYAPPRAALARVAWARGQIGLAIRRYRAVVARYPLPEYVIALGDLQTLAGRPADARRSYGLVRVEERLFRAAGVNVDLELALFDADHGRPRAALAAARAEWDRRRSVLVADALGWALHRVGHDAAALRYARFAQKLGYHSALFSFHQGMIEMAVGRLDAARRHLSDALSINPNFSIAQAPVARRALSRLDRGR